MAKQSRLEHSQSYSEERQRKILQEIRTSLQETASSLVNYNMYYGELVSYFGPIVVNVTNEGRTLVVVCQNEHPNIRKIFSILRVDVNFSKIGKELQLYRSSNNDVIRMTLEERRKFIRKCRDEIRIYHVPLKYLREAST